MGQTLAVNGVRLHVEVREPAIGAGDRTIALLHGFTGSAAGWGPQLDALAAAGWRAVALDMLGHGGSNAPDDPARYAIERCREDIIAALEQLGARAGQVVLLGYSMGGRIALHAARSGWFRALILESASPGLGDPAERAARRASDDALAQRIERDGVPAFVAYWEALPLFASQSDLPLEQRAALHAQRLTNRAAGVAGSLRGVGAGVQPPQHAALPDLRLPVLIIAGARDAKFAALAREMAAVLPDARLAIVPGAGHCVHLEAPQLFDDLVRTFLASLPSPS